VKLSEKLLGNYIVRTSDGKTIGVVSKIFLNKDGRNLKKIALQNNNFVSHEDIVLLGEDVVLVNQKKKANTHVESKQLNLETDSACKEPAQGSMVYAANKNLSKETTGINWWTSINQDNL
jgi:uncharacterized protein YrrD